jgi:hypothetical protein
MLVGALQDNGPSVGFAIAGGLVLGMGNLMSQYAWPFVGISIANVISASITVVGGTLKPYNPWEKKAGE